MLSGNDVQQENSEPETQSNKGKNELSREPKLHSPGQQYNNNK